MKQLIDFDGTIMAMYPRLPANDGWNEERKLDLYVQHSNFVRDVLMAGAFVLAVMSIGACWWAGAFS
jgi:hypothetical protein